MWSKSRSIAPRLPFVVWRVFPPPPGMVVLPVKRSGASPNAVWTLGRAAAADPAKSAGQKANFSCFDSVRLDSPGSTYLYQCVIVVWLQDFLIRRTAVVCRKILNNFSNKKLFLQVLLKGHLWCFFNVLTDNCWMHLQVIHDLKMTTAMEVRLYFYKIEFWWKKAASLLFSDSITCICRLVNLIEARFI